MWPCVELSWRCTDQGTALHSGFVSSRVVGRGETRASRVFFCGRRRIPCRFFSIEATRNVKDLFYFRSPPGVSFCFFCRGNFFSSHSPLRLFGFIVYLERSSHAGANFKGSFLPARVLFLRADQIFPGKPQANWPYQMARICTNKISKMPNTHYLHSTLNVRLFLYNFPHNLSSKINLLFLIIHDAWLNAVNCRDWCREFNCYTLFKNHFNLFSDTRISHLRKTSLRVTLQSFFSLKIIATAYVSH